MRPGHCERWTPKPLWRWMRCGKPRWRSMCSMSVQLWPPAERTQLGRGALDMLESCGRQGLRLDVVTFNSLLQALRASAKGSWKAVLQILFSMPGRALLPTDKTRSTAIGACASLWQESTALAGSCNQSKVACNTLITSCGRAFQWRRSLQVVYEMVRMQPDLVTVDAVVTSCTTGSHWGRALQLPEALCQQPDVVLYSSLMVACAEGALWEEALEILGEMVRRQSSPDLFSFSAAIHACNAAEQWEMGLAIFDELTQEMKPNVVAFSAAMTALARGSHWQRVLDLLLTMRFMREVPNEVTLLAALDACGRGRQWVVALALLATSWSCRIRVSQSSYTVATWPVQMFRRWEQCLSLVADMPVTGIAPNEINFSATTLACEKSSRWTVAVDLLHGRGHGTRRSLLRVGSVIGACENAFQWHRALALLNDMWLFQLQANVMTCNGALSACAAARRWVRALQTYALTAGRRMRPSVVTGSALLSTLEKGDSWRSALRTLYEMSHAQLQREDMGIKAVLLCCSDQRQWPAAAQLLQILELHSSLAAGLAWLAHACEDLGLMAPAVRLLDDLDGSRSLENELRR
ncbi:unnamed protein product [Durusdinium trenchii]|uniref:Pentatricopeptide repeat-containing protein, chloroplastic n=1 Tax=Durusdinium trenchii TaxID=1381693 RepID=A0ABP0P173_9DINO